MVVAHLVNSWRHNSKKLGVSSIPFLFFLFGFVVAVVLLYLGAIYLLTVSFAANYQLDVPYNIRNFLSNFWEKMSQPRTGIYITEKDHS